MSGIRVNLFFPENHIIGKISKKERANKIKEMIQFSLTYQEQIQKIEEDLNDIKQSIEQIKQLLNQSVPYQSKLSDKPKTSKSLDLERADRELIKSILKM